MYVEDVVRRDILTRLSNLKTLYEKTLKELKDYDTLRYRSYILPVVKEEKVKSRKDIIIAYVRNQEKLTAFALVQHLMQDAEYGAAGKVEKERIQENIRAMIKDNILENKGGYLKVVSTKGDSISGDDLAKFILNCLDQNPMTSAQMFEEAKRTKIKTTANRLRGMVSKMHMEKIIHRLPLTDPHASWTYTV